MKHLGERQWASREGGVQAVVAFSRCFSSFLPRQEDRKPLASKGATSCTLVSNRPRPPASPLARPGRLPDRQEALFVRTGLRRTHPPVRNRPSPPHHPRQARLLRLLLALPVLLRLVALSAGAELKAERGLLYPVAGGGRVPLPPVSLTCGGPFSFACGPAGSSQAPRGDGATRRQPTAKTPSPRGKPHREGITRRGA